MSPRIRRSTWRTAPCSRRTNALTGPPADVGPGPFVARFLFLDLARDQVDQVPERRHRLAFDANRSSVARLGMPELGHDVVDDHRVLGTLVLPIGEEEDHQVLMAELGQSPKERCEVGAAAHIRHRPVRPGAWRREQTHGPEGLGGQPQRPIETLGILVEAGIGSIEVEKVLPFTLKIRALVLTTAEPSTPDVNNECRRKVA